MSKPTGYDIPTALCQAAVGKIVLEHMEQVPSELLSQAIESRAVQTLEAVRCILENDRLTDEACAVRIDHLTALFFQELGIKIRRNRGAD